jgi:hypothetical protein
VKRALALSLGASSLVAFGALYSFAGCSPGTSEAPEAGAEEGIDAVQDPFEEGPDYCDFDAFTKGGGNGSACSPIAPDKGCFILCEASTGCSCVRGPKGTGVWQCQAGDPCMPTCAPMDPDCGLDGSTFFDTGPVPEASVDAADAADAGDAATDGPSDARADAPRDAGDAG